MKLYYLTDESEKSLAPFFAKRVLEAVLGSAVIVGVILVIFWSRQPLAEFMTTAHGPRLFPLIFAVTLIVNSYVNLCCGGGNFVRKGYFMINYETDEPSYEQEIGFYRYALGEFLLHALLLLLPFLPLLTLAVLSSAVSLIRFMMAVCVLYTTAVLCRMGGFLVYLTWGRSSTLGYFTARGLMAFFVFATILFAPAINPLQLLYQLNQDPNNMGYPFAIYMSTVLFAILIFILVNNTLVRSHINKRKNSRSEVQD
jgi:hypothetical protein